MAHAIRLTGGEGAQETAKFIEHMDKFFDCLNVSSFTEGNESASHSNNHIVELRISDLV